MVATTATPTHKVSSKALTIAFFASLLTMFGTIAVNGYMGMTQTGPRNYPTNIGEALMSQPYIVGSMILFAVIAIVGMKRFFEDL